jgi:hypothetical protein
LTKRLERRGLIKWDEEDKRQIELSEEDALASLDKELFQ